MDTFVFPVVIERTRSQYLGTFEAHFDFSVPSWHTGRSSGERVLHRIKLTGSRVASGTNQVRCYKLHDDCNRHA